MIIIANQTKIPNAKQTINYTQNKSAKGNTKSKATSKLSQQYHNTINNINQNQPANKQTQSKTITTCPNNN